MRISDWSSDVCSSDLDDPRRTRATTVGQLSIDDGCQAAVDAIRRQFVRRAHNVHQCLDRSDEHTSELQSLMRISYAVFCLKKNITGRKFLRHNHRPSLGNILTRLYQTQCHSTHTPRNTILYR